MYYRLIKQNKIYFIVIITIIDHVTFKMYTSEPFDNRQITPVARNSETAK